MSPVSRGRKSKKQKKAQKSRQRAAPAAPYAAPQAEPGGNHLAALADLLFGPRTRPAWFDPSIARVLQNDDAIMAATGPRQLEQVAAELTGAEVYQALHDVDEGVWLDWWFEELAHAASERIESERAEGGNGWQAPWRLLHGLAAIAPPALRAHVMQTAKDAAAEAELASDQPDWLSLCPDGAVTGRIWTMRDGYGTRFAVLAECEYPGGVDPHVFLFDIDACDLLCMAGAAVFDSVDQAAEAWRQEKGDAAETARPEPATGYAQLDCLIHCEVSIDGLFRGDEPRNFTDNLFRAIRRIQDIADVLAKRGQKWPPHHNLYHDREAEIEAAAKGFSAWWAERHGKDPHQEAVLGLAADWIEGTLPGCGSNVSPHRVKYLMTYVSGNWLPDAAKEAVFELLPEWVRWNGEQAGIPEHLIERSAAVAEGQPFPADECSAFPD